MTNEVADDVLGRFARQQHDWFERVCKGSLDPEKVYQAIKPLLQTGRQGKRKKSGPNTTPPPAIIPPPPPPPPDPVLRLRDLWIKFWRVVGGRDLTDREIVLPPYQAGYDLPIIRPSGVTAQQAYDLIVNTKFFACWEYLNDLNILQVMEQYLRPIDEAAVVLIRPSVEPDTRLPYNNAVAQRLRFLGLTHRILLEPFGFWLNREHSTVAQEFGIQSHFDIIGWTRTSSLDPGGRVAIASWYPADGKFRVDWSDCGNAGPGGGIRLAVA